MTIDELIDGANRYYENERGANYNESLIMVWFLYTEFEEKFKSQIQKNDFNPRNYTHRQTPSYLNETIRICNKLEKLEKYTYTKDLEKQLKNVHSDLQRYGTILVSDFLKEHSILNGILAFLCNHDSRVGYYNYWKYALQLFSENKISEKDLEILNQINRFRNLIAHSTGKDFIINLNETRIKILDGLVCEGRKILMDTLFKNIDKNSKIYLELQSFIYTKVLHGNKNKKVLLKNI